MTLFFEIGAVIMGLLQAYLVLKNKRSNWIFYVVQFILLGLFSFSVTLYGDMVMSGFYLIVGVIGWFYWGKDNNVKITKCSNIERVIYIAIILIGIFTLHILLKKTNDVLPFMDSTTTVTSLIATYYMLRKKLDTWVLWFINDILYVIQYWLLPDMALYLLGLNIVWTFMAVWSYIEWNKIIRGQK